jgi:hypothetical protein
MTEAAPTQGDGPRRSGAPIMPPIMSPAWKQETKAAEPKVETKAAEPVAEAPAATPAPTPEKGSEE